ncbi:uroporphyrinogen-III synthase [Meiothermus sp. CFH 77666]|uniref:uroporphyrinogen-III synthase n=1 Tax=Meiothermus sp. CFH 77666 TaxID=2817942 RepID=UPI001AA064FE|nr:uroporphyrinogen-III synthase [Meiothermus sp. CFH 77666]MBO1436878.1 uroporphyrinogen-III synthase [Meiothermus sp. CFH 77666]
MVIALTQSEGRLAGLAEALEVLGLRVLRVPLIETRTLKADLSPLLDCRIWLFTSPAAVQGVLDNGGQLGGRFLGAVGPATQQALEAAGGKVALVAPEASAEGLAEAFLHARPFGFVGLPQGNRARPVLAQRLRAAGYTVRSIPVYETQGRAWPEELSPPDLVLLASPSAVEALPPEIGQKSRLLALGPTTAAALRQRGFPYTLLPQPSAKAVLETIRGMRCSS